MPNSFFISPYWGKALPPVIASGRRGRSPSRETVSYTHLKGKDEVHLTKLEFRLLCVLIAGRGRVLTHRQLLADVWGAAYVERPHYLRLYMARLRQKLESNPTEPLYFMTETGVGYRLKV